MLKDCLLGECSLFCLLSQAALRRKIAYDHVIKTGALLHMWEGAKSSFETANLF